MSEKSYVSIEQEACVVCCKAFDTGALLMNRKLQPTLGHTTVTGWGLCPEHEAMRAEGYVALVECANVPPTAERLTPSEAKRTGDVAFLRASAWQRIMNVPPPEHGVTFCEVGTIAKLAALPGAKEQA